MTLDQLIDAQLAADIRAEQIAREAEAARIEAAKNEARQTFYDCLTHDLPLAIRSALPEMLLCVRTYHEDHIYSHRSDRISRIWAEFPAYDDIIHLQYDHNTGGWSLWSIGGHDHNATSASLGTELLRLLGEVRKASHGHDDREAENILIDAIKEGEEVQSDDVCNECGYGDRKHHPGCAHFPF